MSRDIDAETKIRVVFGNKIKNLREIHGMTQMDLARLLGYDSSGTISLIENGIKGMSKKRVVELAQALKIPVDALLSEQDYSVDDLMVLSSVMQMIGLPKEKRPGHFEAIKTLILATKG